ncbi:SMI1/KNR4 family protein [Dactylosporangium siamense]|uniref:SMI1/KNR4 family protein n=1 Tax=Dactylosporangium siamense TaxID=685454 RepID=UPI001944E973|nr:SMI1/KNR4 family protein [Dactylosporangium siamense]
MDDADPVELWSRLRVWASRWELPPPVLSAGWLCLPPGYRAAAVDGWIVRPLFEPPGDDDAARVLEERTGLRVPADLRALYAVHGGSYAPLLPNGMSLLPYEAMLTAWQYWATLTSQHPGWTPELAGDGTHYQWSVPWSWLPVAENDDGIMVLDSAPGPRGTAGQVLFPTDRVERVVVASSVTDLLCRWLAALDSGEVRFDPALGHAVPVDPARSCADVLRR